MIALMTEEEGWITYGLEAIKHVFEKGIPWKQFREAIRIMQLIPHDKAREQISLVMPTFISNDRTFVLPNSLIKLQYNSL